MDDANNVFHEACSDVSPWRDVVKFHLFRGLQSVEGWQLKVKLISLTFVIMQQHIKMNTT